MLKRELRKEILALRDGLTTEERIKKSKIIAKKVIQYEKFQEADKVLLFASFRSEVDTTEIFKAALALGKEVYFPKVEGKEMEFYRVEKEADFLEGYLGIPEPNGDDASRFAVNLRMEIQRVEESPHVLVIMPGAVFDTECNRIGYGGGYYDKYLGWLEENILQDNLYKLAIAFDCQVIENNRIPKDDYDKNPDAIMTEACIFKKKMHILNGKV